MTRFGLTIIVTLLAVSSFTTQTCAQVTITVSKIPKNTPEGDSIYVAGTFNNWNTTDPKYRLIKQADSSYVITFTPKQEYFEYKFTRGSWSRVEGGEKGGAIGNRAFFYKGSPAKIDLIIKTWEDLETVKIKVLSVPLNTSLDAALYITGPFNRWNPADPKLKFERKDNGTYELIFPSDIAIDTLQYKFTRGSWSSMESDEYGKPISTRAIVRSKSKSQVIENNIVGWEDLSGKAIDFFTFILVMAVFQSIFVAVALNIIQHGKKEANAFLMFMMAFITLMFVVKMLLNNQAIYHTMPKLILLPSFMLFTFSPLLYFYIRKLLLPNTRMGVREYFYYFLPAIILFIIFLPLITMDEDQFVLKLLNEDLTFLFRIIGGLALIFNVGYGILLIKLLKPARYIAEGISEDSLRNYQSYIISLVLLFAVIVLIIFVTYFISLPFLHILKLDEYRIIESGVRLAWMSLALYPFIITWFCVTNPENFRLAVDSEKSKPKDISVVLKSQLTTLMERKKPFLDPDLSMHDLAEILQTNTHTLSRIINEGHSKNFYDFVNDYRITEFKKRVLRGDHKKQTFLSIAHEVGFSSKTTFNRTFKKITGSTPREYLNSLKQEKPVEDKIPK